jgi:hypothetical protein
MIPLKKRVAKDQLEAAALRVADATLELVEASTERDYINAVRDYWITRAELERAVGGNLNPRQSADDKSQPVSNPSLPRPDENN